jgi:hypothetical protein
VLVIRPCREERAGRLGPIVGRCDGERFLVFEVVKKRAFGDARFGAEIIDGPRRIAFLSDQRERGVQQFLASACHRAAHGRLLAHHGD